MRVVLHPAFILHTRPFQDTSRLVEAFTHHYGRVTFLAKGVRSATSKLKGILVPFTPLLISWSTNSELPILSKIENNGGSYNLAKKALLSGLYLNELLMYLLHKHDPHPQIFLTYEATLAALHNNANEQQVLRKFEKHFLRNLGYGLEFDKDIAGLAIATNAQYCLNIGHGFIKINSFTGKNNEFSGTSLLALHNDCLTSVSELNDAKRLFKLVFTALLGNKQLKSRELFFRE